MNHRSFHRWRWRLNGLNTRLGMGLAVLVGHCGLHSLADLPQWRPWGWMLVAAIVAAIALRIRPIAALLLGFAWAWGHAAVRVAEDLPTALEGRDLEVRGYVASIPDMRGADAQFTLDVAEAASGVPPRIRLSWYRCPVHLSAGEQWRLVVRLKRRTGLANPGGFDYEGHLFREGVGATGYVRSDPGNASVGEASWRYAVLRLRAWLAQRIEAAVAKSRMLGIVQGLAIGDTRSMTSPQWRTFAATGTTHLMAISGLHISLLAALAAGLGGAIVRWPGAQRRGWAARHGQVVAGVCAALAYSALAGMSIPTQRTLIMLCTFFAARAWRRTLPPMHALGMALIGVLLVDPFAPLAVGAWLSFGAVSIILLTVVGRLEPHGVVGGFARVQWAITIGLTPILLSAFGGVSLIAAVANAVAVPLFTLIVVPLVLLGAVAAAISTTVGGAVLALPVGVLEACWPTLEWLGRIEGGYWFLPQVPLPILGALTAGVVLLVLPGILATRIAGIMLCVPLLLYRPAAPAHGTFELAVLDVGQGLAVVVRTANRVLLYDAGPAFRTGRDAGELAVVPYLRARGIRAIDMLMVSHGDLDHRGGLKSIAASLPMHRALVGPSVELAGTARCERGQRWVWDGVLFEVLHPSAGSAASDNDSSCVVRIASRAGSALLPGDVQGEAEEALIRQGLPQTDVVVVPHHGSRTSSGAAFVASVGATHALIAAGYRNRWDLPNEDVLERWRRSGARTYVTADSGALEVNFSDEGPRVREYRLEHRRYWRLQKASRRPKSMDMGQ
jgi:competence protein ComEC